VFNREQTPHSHSLDSSSGRVGCIPQTILIHYNTMKSKEIEDYIYQSDIELYSKVYKTIEDEYSKMDIKTFIELVEILDSLKVSIRSQILTVKKRELFDSKKKKVWIMIKERLSKQDLMKMYNVDRTTIEEWRRRFGLPMIEISSHSKCIRREDLLKWEDKMKRDED
jgi:hypothetical protein